MSTRILTPKADGSIFLFRSKAWARLGPPSSGQGSSRKWELGLELREWEREGESERERGKGEEGKAGPRDERGEWEVEGGREGMERGVEKERGRERSSHVQETDVCKGHS